MTARRRALTPLGNQRWRVRKHCETGEWEAGPISDGSFDSLLSSAFRTRRFAVHAEALDYAIRVAEADKSGWVVAAK